MSIQLLRGTRLDLVSPRRDHADGLFAYGSDPEFCAFIDRVPFRERADALVFVDQLIKDNARRRRHYWVIEEAGTGVAIGTIGFNLIFPEAQRVLDFGYGVSRRYWGRGFFAEAAALAIDYGFDVLGAARLQASTRADNVASIRAVEKIGFIREGTLRDYYQLHDRRCDCVVLGLCLSDWRAGLKSSFSQSRSG